MASLILENCTSINERDDLERLEALGIDESIFTSLMEESQDEGCTDERLYGIIQSLEAEINYNSDDARDFAGDIEMVSSDGYSHIYTVEEEDERYFNSLLLQCAEMELPSLPVGEDMDFCVENYGVEMNGLIDFGCVGADFINIRDEVYMEELSGSSLWQESYDMLISS